MWSYCFRSHSNSNVLTPAAAAQKTHYNDGITKIHDAISREQSLAIKNQELQSEQLKQLGDIWDERWLPHLSNSSVIVLVITAESLLAMANPKDWEGIKLLKEVRGRCSAICLASVK